MDKKRSNDTQMSRSHDRRDRDANYTQRFDSDYDYILKMVLIGDSCVGKSVMMRRYVDGDYPYEPYISTIGVDFSIRRIEIDNSDGDIKFTLCNNSRKTKPNNNSKLRPNPFKVKLQIWDTAGQERFRSITQSYYRGMRVCVLCFDGSKRGGELGSINNVMKWLNDVKHYAGTNTYVYVVGTKIDLPNISITMDSPEYIDNMVEKIEEYEGLHVKFMGWCSSKQNIYLRDLDDITDIVKGSDHYHWSEERIEKLELESDNPKNNMVPTISDMLEEIVCDFIHSEAKLDNGTRIRLYDHELEEYFNSDEPPKKSCCNIL